ncbi:hypothetical protein A3F86_06295 [candidate division WOR-1 bacterium RIFCSPLOWO2_12_FULL_45_9]|uniref:PEGA domain-containing protein n=1 Tax=candidate division WOR-1 bacterium RIFCSPLOWO2_12_FULL_45_9 TaxID=1802568 RepID=A0A1F4RN56_UNCSA|nr:MAG: hypothetical protein A3F86_06295 [candidate division WOR-1 bacterium RIFCSPLOWO2_12_FULL_45_9]
MKKLIILLFVFTLFVGAAVAQDKGDEQVFGKLSVYSDVPDTDIYVDARYIGRDRASMSNISVGKHYVRVVKGEKSLLSGIVDVKEGEETVVVAKVEADSLEESRRKSNYVFFFGGLTDLGYDEAIPGANISYDYKPQLGFGAEVNFNTKIFDSRIDLGFFQNYPAGIVISATQEAQMSVSTPYINISKNIFKNKTVKVNAGGGLNFGIFSPGYRTSITIASRPGYQAFIEATRSGGESHYFVVRLGYVKYAGESAFPGQVTSAGYYLQSGMAYEL